MKKLALSRPVFAWAMYDFANSAFATSFLSVIFGVYFTNVLVPPGGVQFFGLRVPGESLWSYLISSVMLCVVILAPLLGSYADRHAAKRPLLIFWASVGAVATMAAVRATAHHLKFVCLLVFVATLGFEMSLVFYNAFLKDIADDEIGGRVSGFGFALGYVGGGLCLLLNLMMIRHPASFGLPTSDPTAPIRVGMFIVGAWWFLFSVPTFLWVKDASIRPSASNKINVMETIRWVRTHSSVLRFLGAYLVYEDGTQTLILMASIFGAKALGMSASELAMCYLMIQFVAFGGALVCGHLADRWSHKKVVVSTLLIFSAVVTWAVFMRRPVEFWILGVIVGLVMGGNQAASRSLFSSLIPPERSTELFAFFSIVGKAAAFMGPLVFGMVAQFWGLRAGVASLLVFFVVGGLILKGVIESPPS